METLQNKTLKVTNCRWKKLFCTNATLQQRKKNCHSTNFEVVHYTFECLMFDRQREKKRRRQRQRHLTILIELNIFIYYNITKFYTKMIKTINLKPTQT